MTADLTNGGSLTLAGLPAGAECVVTETDAKGATTTTVTTTTSAGTTGPTAGTTTTADLTPNGPLGLVTNRVVVTNAFDVGSLHLIKDVEGPGAADFGAGPFLLHVTCTLDDASGSRTVWNGNVVLGGSQPLDKTIGDIATGASCVVTEPGPGGANSSVVDPGTVTIGTDDTVAVTATNTFLAGAIHVTKIVTGPGAELYGTGPFDVQLTCIRLVDGVPTAVTIPGGATRVMDTAGGFAADYLLLPAGSTCVLRETGTAGATTANIVDANGRPAVATVVQPGETVELTDTNTFDLGSLQVTKSVTGGGAATRGTASFVVHLECTLVVNGVVTSVPIPGGADRALSTSTTLTATYDQLPTGAECTVTETSSGGADKVTITPNAGDEQQGTATIGDATVINVDVVNEFDPPEPSGLVDTGSDVWPWLLAGVGAILAGAFVLMGLGRRRRDS